MLLFKDMVSGGIDVKSDIAIRVASMDSGIQALLESAKPTGSLQYTQHFNQGEEFFLELNKNFNVSRFPIHHDVRQTQMSEPYRNALKETVAGLIEIAPDFLADLRYFFDPTQIFYPSFYQLYSVQGRFYLYLLRIDLSFRPLEADLVLAGDNDMSAAYTTRRLYLSADLIPLEGIIKDDERIRGFRPLEMVGNTWIGESGKGYLLRGIWMDSDLTKFFTKLFTPAGKRLYPYYPYSCKHRSLCLSLADMRPATRKNLISYLHHAVEYILPAMREIEGVLKSDHFSEDLEVYKRLKEGLASELYGPWTELGIEFYLNANDQKEYRVVFGQ